MATTVSYALETAAPTFRADSSSLSTQGPDVVGLSGGGFAFSYLEYGGPGGYDGRVEFYDSSYARVGGSLFPAGGPTNTLGQIRMTELAGGDVVAGWADWPGGSDPGANRAAIFDPETGTPVGGPIDVSRAYGWQTTAALANGNFVYTHAASHNRIIGRIYDETGEQDGPAFLVDDAPNVYQTEAVGLVGGGFVVAWLEQGAMALHVRVFDDTGAPLTDDQTIGPAGQYYQQLAALPNGNFAVVCSDAASGVRAGAALRIYSPTLENLTPGLSIDLDTRQSSSSEFNPEVAVLANGFIVVTWAADRSALNGRIFDQDGNPVSVAGGSSYKFSLERGYPIVDPVLSAISDGAFVALWDMAGDGIAAQVRELTRTVTIDAAGDGFAGDELRDSILGGAGDDVLSGGGADDSIDGGGGMDHLDGGPGDDLLRGGQGADTVIGGDGGDHIRGEDGVDRLRGFGGDDTILGGGAADRAGGGDGDDLMDGGLGNDRMKGQVGDDTLRGAAGRDSLDGGRGGDTLAGGGGADTFAYAAAAETVRGDEDLITDLQKEDLIDLSRIDAGPGAGDQAFILVAAFGGNAGELVVAFHATGPYAGLTTVQGDIDGDGLADFAIRLAGDWRDFDNFAL